MFIYKPEKTNIPGLRDKASSEYAKLGSINRKEIFVSVVVAFALVLLVLQSLIPALKTMDRAVPLLLAGILFFLSKVLTLVFLLAVCFLVLVMTNFIMNVAAIAITLPVVLVMGLLVIMTFTYWPIVGMPALLK